MITSNRCPYCNDGDHIAGVEIPAVYDGALYWMCGGCERPFHRFKDGFLHDLAERYVYPTYDDIAVWIISVNIPEV